TLPAQPITRDQQPVATEPEPMTEEQLLAELIHRLRLREESDFAKAIRGAGVSLMDRRYEIDTSLLAPLSSRERQWVQRYHQLLLMTRQELAQNSGQLDRQRIDQWLDDLFAEQPLHIRK